MSSLFVATSICATSIFIELIYGRGLCARKPRQEKLVYCYTSNLKRRLSEHLLGRGGRTTRLGGEWKLIYAEAYLHKDDAMGREKFLKSGSGRKFLKKQLKNYLLAQGL